MKTHSIESRLVIGRTGKYTDFRCVRVCPLSVQPKLSVSSCGNGRVKFLMLVGLHQNIRSAVSMYYWAS